MHTHGINPELGQSLIGHSFILCSIFIPAFLLDGNNFGSKNLKLCWYPHFSTGGPVYLLQVVSSGSISSPAKVTHIDSWVPLNSQISVIFWRFIYSSVPTPDSSMFPFFVLVLLASLLSSLIPYLNPVLPLPFPTHVPLSLCVP